MKKLILIIFVTTLLINSYSSAETDDPSEPENEELPFEVKASRLQEWGASNQWHLDVVDNIEDFSFNIENAITVAVLDTGVTKVSDLSCVNFVNEFNARNKTTGPGSAIDRNGHGTKVSLIIAACEDGPFGKGIASGINIMPIKVLGDNGWGSLWHVMEGIYWAVENGADVINMSLGGFCKRTFEQGCRYKPMDDAIEYANSRGVAVIASSMNNGLNFIGYPANHPKTIAVGAVNEAQKTDDGFDRKIEVTSWSNTGEELDFVAPGRVSTLLGNVAGTSFSAPQVAAAYAVFKNNNPGIKLKTIKEGLVCTVIDLGSVGWDPEYGHGLIQINATANVLNHGFLQKPFFAGDDLDFSFENKNLHIHWPFLDDCNGIEKISIQIEKDGIKEYFNVSSEQSSFVYKNIDDGFIKVNVRATNILGTNSDMLFSSFTVDRTSPVWNDTLIKIIESDKKLIIDIPEAFDENGILEYVLQVNDNTFRLNKNTRQYIFVPDSLSDGQKFDISIYPIDTFGNKGDILTNSYIAPDRTPPEYDGTPLINIEEQTLNNISISWPVFEDNSGIKHYRLVYSAINNPELSGEVLLQDTKYEFTNLPENIKYSFILYVVDNEDNEVICCTKVVEAKDVIPPTWKELNLGLSITATDGRLLFAWDDAEDNIQLKSYNLRLFDQFRNQIEYVQLSPNQTNYQTSQDLFENGYVLGEIVAADIYGNLSDKRDNDKDFQAPVWGDNTEISFVYEDGFLSINWPDAKDNIGVLSYLVRFEFYNNDNLEGTDEFRVSESFINNYEPYTNDIDYIYISISPSDFTNDGEFIKSNLILLINNSEAITSSTTSSSTSSTTSSSTSSTTSSSTSSTTSSSTSSTTSSSTSSTTSSSTSTSTTTTTIDGINYTPTGTLTGSCPLLSNSTSATSPLFKQVNNNVYPFGPTESAFSGYEGCMYSGLTRDEIKKELIRYLDYWKQFDQNEFKYLKSVQSRNWRNDSALNAAASRWGSEWSNVNSSSIVENLSRSDGQLVWDDEYWAVGITTTTLPTYSDPDTTNTVLGSPTIKSIIITTVGSEYKAVIGFDLAPAVKDLEIVGHSCDYYANPSSGSISGNFGVDTKTCELNVPQREQVSFKVAAKYGNYVNCNEPNDPSTCVQIDNAQYGPYCEWVTVTLTGEGSVSDSSVLFSWDGASTPTTTTTTSSTTTTTVPGDTTTTTSSTTTTTTSTTTTTLPPSNTTTTTVPCKTLDEAKSLWISNNVRLKACQGCVPRNGASRYVVDPSGSTTAQVNGTTQNVSLQPTGELQVGDTFLSGESGDAGLLLWTHTVTVAPVQGSCTSNCGGRAEWTPVYPDSEVERFAREQYEICP